MQQNEREIDVGRLLSALWRRIWIILICALLGGVLAFLYTRYFVTPMYQSSVTMYVDNRSTAEEEDGYVSSSSLSTAQRLVKTYAAFIESDSVLNEVIEQSGLQVSAGRIRSMITVAAVNDTEVFKISITCDDPREAALIANVIGNVAVEKIPEILSGTNTKVIDGAKVSGSPVSPNYQKNVILGILVCTVIAMAVICVMAVLDVRILTEDDLIMISEFPILGSIPSFDSTEHSGGKYSREQYGYGRKPGEEDEV